MTKQDTDPVALRGTTVLTEMDLQAHLAGLMELPHVGMLLGAGASKCAGGQLVTEMVAGFDGWLANQPAEFAARRESLLKRTGGQIDIEATWTNVGLVVENPWLSVDAELQKVAKALATELQRELKQAARVQRDQLQHHERLLRKLLSSRDPGQPPRWVFTTNYDIAIELAAESVGAHVVNGFVGLHERRFEPAAMDLGLYLRAARGEARFGAPYICLAKLHGSLSWFTTQAGEVEELSAHAAVAEAREPVLIPPSKAKYTDTVGFVQGEMFRRLAEFVQMPDSVLLVNGYALSDHHLNRLLFTGLLNPTFHLVLCCCPSTIEGGVLKPASFATDTVPGNPQPSLPPQVEELARGAHPAVTFVSGRAGGPSTFQRFVELLPDPALLDEESRKTRQFVRDLLRIAEQRAAGRPGDAK